MKNEDLTSKNGVEWEYIYEDLTRKLDLPIKNKELTKQQPGNMLICQNYPTKIEIQVTKIC